VEASRAAYSLASKVASFAPSRPWSWPQPRPESFAAPRVAHEVAPAVSSGVAHDVARFVARLEVPIVSAPVVPLAVSADATWGAVGGPTTPRQNCGPDQASLPQMVYVLPDARAENRSFTSIGEAASPKRNPARSSSFVIVDSKSSSFRGFRTSDFWFLHSGFCTILGLPYPPDRGGNSCPRYGPRSCVRNSRRSRTGNGGRSCPGSGVMTGPCSCTRSSIRTCTCSGSCNCASNCTRPWHRSSLRSGGRDSPRTRAGSWPRNCDRNGRRNGSQNSIRSSLCSGPTSSPRTDLCPTVSGTCLRSEDNRGGLSPAPTCILYTVYYLLSTAYCLPASARLDFRTTLPIYFDVTPHEIARETGERSPGAAGGGPPPGPPPAP
jgi:hypothetical protein